MIYLISNHFILHIEFKFNFYLGLKYFNYMRILPAEAHIYLKDEH